VQNEEIDLDQTREALNTMFLLARDLLQIHSPSDIFAMMLRWISFDPA
jgi:hypothetical protein